MAQKIQDIQEEAENKERLEDHRETKAAAQKASTQTMQGDLIPTAVVDPKDDERPVEEIPGMLDQIQRPHGNEQGEVATAIFTTSYGQKVRAAV